MDTEQIPAQEQEQAAPRNPKEGRLYKLGRWTVRVIFSLFVVFLLLSLLLQVPAVQNRLARYVTAELTDYLGAGVSRQVGYCAVQQSGAGRFLCAGP
ncbi:MAG TPA: hypothetical protein PK198_14370 [Saprospiraceae bacterium]|nr:hypothetical protein [Saprospiraceae bacterium]